MKVIILLAISYFTSFLELIIFLRAISSLFNFSQSNQFIRVLYTLTEPILSPIRSLLRRSFNGMGGTLDFSPIIAYFIIRIGSSIISGIVAKLPF